MINTRYQLDLEIGRQQAITSDIAKEQSQLSSQKKLLAPSDDPVASARIAQIARSQADQTAWSTNLDTAADLSARADTALSSVSTAFNRANELMVQAANGTLSASDRVSIAQELSSLADQVQTLENTTDSQGNALFSDGTPLTIPVGPSVSIGAVDSKANVFGSVSVSGGVSDLVTILTKAASAVSSSDASAISGSLAEVGAAISHVAEAQGAQGARGNRIDSLQSSLQSSGLQLSSERSELQDVDVADVVAKLNSQELTLSAAQAAFARINQSTLFDLLK